MGSRIQDDLRIDGHFSAKTLTLPDGNVTDAKVAGGAGISATKLAHQYAICLADESDVPPDTRTRKVHIVYGATGTFVAAWVSVSQAATGNATHTTQVTINGVNALTGAITIDNTVAINTNKDGTIGTSALVRDNIIRVVETATPGTGELPEGLSIHLIIREDAE